MCSKTSKKNLYYSVILENHGKHYLLQNLLAKTYWSNKSVENLRYSFEGIKLFLWSNCTLSDLEIFVINLTKEENVVKVLKIKTIVK